MYGQSFWSVSVWPRTHNAPPVVPPVSKHFAASLEPSRFQLGSPCARSGLSIRPDFCPPLTRRTRPPSALCGGAHFEMLIPGFLRRFRQQAVSGFFVLHFSTGIRSSLRSCRRPAPAIRAWIQETVQLAGPNLIIGPANVSKDDALS